MYFSAVVHVARFDDVSCMDWRMFFTSPLGCHIMSKSGGNIKGNNGYKEFKTGARATCHVVVTG